MITKSVFTNLIRAMEGIHDLEEVIEQMFGFNPGPKDRETILSRLFAAEDAVYEILGVDDKENVRVREIAGSDMDLEQKVELLMRLYPGRVDTTTANGQSAASSRQFVVGISVLTPTTGISPPMRTPSTSG